MAEQIPEEQKPEQTQDKAAKTQRPKPQVKAREPPSDDAIILEFEVCQNCNSHAWCTHHDEDKYVQLFLDCQALIESNIPNSYCTFNEGIKPGIGAFEVRHKGILIYSKKNTQLFPQAPLLTQRIQTFLDDLQNQKDVTKWATKKEVKYEPPKQKKERETFQTYMKKREEEERKKKEQIEQARIKAEEEEKQRQEEEQRRQEEYQRQEEERKKKEEEDKKIAEAKAEKEKLEAEEIKRKEEEAASKQQEQEQQQEGQGNQEQPAE